MQKQSAQRQTRRNPAKISKVAVLRFSALQSSVTGFGISGSQGLSFLVLLYLLLLFFFFTPSLVNTFAPLKQYNSFSDSLVKIQSNVAPLIWIHHYWIWADYVISFIAYFISRKLRDELFLLWENMTFHLITPCVCSQISW